MENTVKNSELDLSTFDADVEEVAMFIEQSDSALLLLGAAQGRC